MRIDPKTARRFATGRLKTLEEDFNDALSELILRPIKGQSPRSNPKQKRIEESVRKLHPDSFIGGDWVSRTYIYFVFELEKHDDGKPNQLAINGWRFNTRSNTETVKLAAIITMHAMERLIERRENPDIIKAALEEFDLNFVNEIVFGRLKPKEEFEIQTFHGKACGIVSDTGIPIVRTWIRIPALNQNKGIKGD